MREEIILNNRPKRSSAWFRRLLLLALVGGVIFFGFNHFSAGSREPEAGGAESATVQIPEVDLEAGPFQLRADWLANLSVRTETVGQGDNLSLVLDRLGIDASACHYMAEAAKPVFDLTKIRAGAKVSLYRDPSGQAVRLEYLWAGTPPVILINTPAGFAASRPEYELVRLKNAVEGRIKNSLWGSAVQQYGLDPGLVMNFADIFAYEVDFLTEVRSGDVFRLLYEMKYSQGQALGPGRILAAEFVNEGRSYKAYFHEDSSGESGYYDAEGRSLKKMFLKSPLQYRRISSYFSRSRYHPILKIRRPHLGIDYSAPKSTPVEALGNGRISFIGWKGGYGKFIVINHNHGYITQYGHLSGFAKGLKRGSRVEQGQLIAYVGSTGLSTGPHLDFRIKKDGKYVDPLSMKFKPAPPLGPKERPAFLKSAKGMRAEMNSLLAAKITGDSQQVHK